MCCTWVSAFYATRELVVPISSHLLQLMIHSRARYAALALSSSICCPCFFDTILTAQRSAPVHAQHHTSIHGKIATLGALLSTLSAVPALPAMALPDVPPHPSARQIAPTHELLLAVSNKNIIYDGMLGTFTTVRADQVGSWVGCNSGQQGRDTPLGTVMGALGAAAARLYMHVLVVKAGVSVWSPLMAIALRPCFCLSLCSCLIQVILRGMGLATAAADRHLGPVWQGSTAG